MKKSILLSLISFIISFCIIILLLYIIKPSFILYIEIDNKKIIDNYKLFYISIIISLFISISIFLFVQKPSKETKSKSNFSFEYDQKSINQNLYKKTDLKLNSNQIIV